MLQCAFVGLGSNQGDREKNLARACAELEKIPGVAVQDLSSVYFTEPQEMRDQPWFANQAARLEIRIRAVRLLEHLLAIETSMGRKRSTDPALRYGPRIIDLDLLLVEGRRITSPTLTLPHPALECRAFVLIPLRDLAPALRLPSGRTCDEALASLDYMLEGNRISQQPFKRVGAET